MSKKATARKNQDNTLCVRMSQVLYQICEILELNQEDFQAAVEAVGEDNDEYFMKISFEHMKKYIKTKVPDDYIFKHSLAFKRTIIKALEWCAHKECDSEEYACEEYTRDKEASEDGYILILSDKIKVHSNWKKNKSKCEDLLFQVFEEERKRRYIAIKNRLEKLKNEEDDTFFSLLLLSDIMRNGHKINSDGDFLVPKTQYDAFKRLLLNDDMIYKAIQKKNQEAHEAQENITDIDLAVLPPLS